MTKPIKKVAKKKAENKTTKRKRLTYDKIKSIKAVASVDGVITYKISKELMSKIINLRDEFSVMIAQDFTGTYIEFLTQYFIESAADPKHFSNIERLALHHEMLTATDTKNWFYNAIFGQYEYCYSYIADDKEEKILMEKLK